MSKLRIRLTCDVETRDERRVDARRLRLLVEQHVSLALVQLFDEVAVERVEIGRVRPHAADLLLFKKRRDA